MSKFKSLLKHRPRTFTINSAIVFSLFFTLVAVLPGWGATYYMRADGTAKSKTAATSCSYPSGAMSVATHNASTFSPGDVICLCDVGGDYKSSIIAPSSGTNSLPITYKNADGQTPTIDLSVNVGGTSGWTAMGGGVYRKTGFGRVLWEDNVPLKAASSTACTDGNWYYPNGSDLLYYKPTSGTPASHTIQTMWFDATTNAIDLRNRSNITVYGLAVDRSGYGIKHGNNTSSPVSSIQNIILHDNTITRSFWAIYSDVVQNGIESNVSIYNNNINYCNSGISAWTASDTTPGHTEHHTGYSITGNQILNLYSITATKVWSDALLADYYYNDHEGISFQDVQNSVISNNVITNSFVKDMTSDEYWSRAIYLYLTNGNSPTSGNTITGNYITGHFYPAIYICTASGSSGFQNNVIDYNVINYTLSNAGHISFGVNAASNNPLTGTNYFVNNTIYNATVGVGIYCPYSVMGKWVLRNNIVISPSHAVVSSAGVSGFTFDHNLYDTTASFQIGTAGMTFAQWQAQGYDKVGSMVANPHFVSPGTNFHLASSSPAINAGIPPFSSVVAAATGPGTIGVTTGIVIHQLTGQPIAFNQLTGQAPTVNQPTVQTTTPTTSGTTDIGAY